MNIGDNCPDIKRVCSTCKHYSVHFEVSYQEEFRQCDLMVGGEEDKHRVTVYKGITEEYPGAFYVGPEFGCIHWKAKEINGGEK